MMAEQGRNMSLNQPVVDLQLLFVCCVKTVQFNKICYMYTTGWKHSNRIQINSVHQHNYFIAQGTYIGYMF